jgi:cell division septal protein FtsQ
MPPLFSSLSNQRRSSSKNRRKVTFRQSKLPRSTKKKASPHLLEVKMRAHSVRRQKKSQLLTILWRMAIGAFVALGLILGGKTLAEKFFLKNRDYTLQHINASLDGVMSLSELEEKTGIIEGKNIFLCNIGRAETILRNIPEVKKVNIERIWPDTINVSLTHRQPILRLADSNAEGFVPGESLLIDEEGVVIHSSKLDETTLQLPLVVGIKTTNLPLGKALQGEKAIFLHNFYQALSELQGADFVLQSIDLSHDYYAIITDDQKSHFIFGEEDIPGQMRRLTLLLEYCQHENKVIETANLILEHNTPVTFQKLLEEKVPSNQK